MALVPNHGGRDFFAQYGMRAAKSDCRSDGGMSQEYLIHFVGRNILASADDDVLHPTCQMQIAVAIEKSFVAGTKPSIRESAGVGLRIIFVSAKDVRSLNSNFAPLVGAEVIALLVHDADA